MSLHVGADTGTSTVVYTAKSTRAGNAETVRITAPVAGTYYVKLAGDAAFSGVTLLATQ